MRLCESVAGLPVPWSVEDGLKDRYLLVGMDETEPLRMGDSVHDSGIRATVSLNWGLHSGHPSTCEGRRGANSLGLEPLPPGPQPLVLPPLAALSYLVTWTVELSESRESLACAVDLPRRRGTTQFANIRKQLPKRCTAVK